MKDWDIKEEYGLFGLLVPSSEIATSLSKAWGGTEVNYVSDGLYHVAFPSLVEESLSKEVEKELLSFVNLAREALGAEEISSLPTLEEDSSIWIRLWKAFDQIDDGWYVDLREDGVIFSRPRAAEAVAAAWGSSVREEKEYCDDEVLHRYIVDLPDGLARLVEMIYTE